jgi:hypothetical protein
MWGTYPYYYSVDQAGNLVTPTVGFPTRATRDVIRTGGLWNFDMSIFKNIPIRERYSIRLRLEGYNVFNHPNFDDKNFGVNINGPWQCTYGTPAGAGSSSPDITISKATNWSTPADTYNPSGGPGGFRVIQLGAKFIF